MITYKIYLHGHLDRRWETLFDGFTITHQVTPNQKPVTVMTGEVALKWRCLDYLVALATLA